MTLLTICQTLAKDVGRMVPDVVATSGKRDWIEAVNMSNATGEELARRVDWGQLTKTTTLTGDGTNKKFTMPEGFSRIVAGEGVKGSNGAVRPLTRAEWADLTPVEGVPRYFLLEGDGVTLWPYLASGETVTVYYQSKNWCSNGGSTWTADTETALIDEALMAKGLIVRWRRQKGMQYADHEAEYEAAVADLANFNDRSRL